MAGLLWTAAPNSTQRGWGAAGGSRGQLHQLPGLLPASIDQDWGDLHGLEQGRIVLGLWRGGVGEQQDWRLQGGIAGQLAGVRVAADG